MKAKLDSAGPLPGALDLEKAEQLAVIFVEWTRGLDSETRAKRDQELASYAANPGPMTAFFDEMFAAADADGDNLLNLDEYISYCRTAIPEAVARFDRVSPPFDEDRARLEYEIYNMFTPGVEGISKDDYKKVMGHIFKRVYAKLGNQ